MCFLELTIYTYIYSISAWYLGIWSHPSWLTPLFPPFGNAVSQQEQVDGIDASRYGPKAAAEIRLARKVRGSGVGEW